MKPLLQSRWRRRFLALLIGVALTFCIGELGLRWLLFSDSLRATRMGWQLRHPEWFASPNHDDYWKLYFRFTHAADMAAPTADKLTGWLTDEIVPGTHEHVATKLLGERRPILLYGDSYTQGVGSDAKCFPELVESSPLASGWGLINYGVGGFGADQVLLLLRDTLAGWQSRDPVVIVALLVDDDLDRSILQFRSGPKPLFRLEQGKLVDPEPVETNVACFLDRYPISIKSYLARLFEYAPGMLPASIQYRLRGDDSRLAEKQALNEAIVRAICRELKAHSAHSTLMLMRARWSMHDPNRAAWQEALVRRVAQEEGVSLLDTRGVLLHAVDDQINKVDGLYLLSGGHQEHWNSQGYLTTFQLLRAFVEGGTEQDALAYVSQLRLEKILSGGADPSHSTPEQQR